MKAAGVIETSRSSVLSPLWDDNCGMDIQIHQADGRVTRYPDATGYELMADAVLKVDVDGSPLFFNSRFWLQFAVEATDSDPFNVNLNPLR
ncbi:hypothetical protein [Mycobacterium sp. EPa45]|uniref:hypothetical protein n=1 Tax=Mycobacterium sp. EPa45 TaxID=1545728 RepID=UPI000641B4FF|nr:hypothetical protein [Mycobacterium sp. EPa45]AKK26146.1 hypothetical protein AB431_04940 [Mycobacterium sp. EPa45]